MSAPEYRIYWNGGGGGPVSLAAPLGETPGTSFDAPPLPAGADATFLVRAFDPSTGLDDGNGDARVRVRLAADGSDLTGLPNAPVGLSASPRAGGTALLAWAYDPGGQGGAPSGFRVYAGSPAPDYSHPAATVAFDPGAPGRHYLATLAGLAGGVAYRAACRAYNAAGEEPNVFTCSFTAATPAQAPAAVPSLTATATP